MGLIRRSQPTTPKERRLKIASIIWIEPIVEHMRSQRVYLMSSARNLDGFV